MKEITLPYSKQVVAFKERITFEEKMKIQKAFVGKKPVSLDGTMGSFNYEDVLDGSMITLEVVILTVDGKPIENVKDWINKLDGEDGDVLMLQAMEYFGDSQKKN